MEITVPVKGADLSLIVQLRFFADRHLVLITDSKSRSHGTVYQVEAKLDESSSAELHPAVDPAAAAGVGPVQKQKPPRQLDDDFEAELERQMMPDAQEETEDSKNVIASSNAKPRPIPLNVELFPVLGSDRDNQWALLLGRRIATAIAESFIAQDLADSDDRQQHELRKMSAAASTGMDFVPTARFMIAAAQKAFSMTLMLVVHIPPVLDEDDGMKHSEAVMEAVRAIETQLRQKLHGEE